MLTWLIHIYIINKLKPYCRSIFTVIIIVFTLNFSFCQNPWNQISYVKNFSISEMGQSAPKSYDISQHEDGTMYFANEYGLLQFTGNEWEIIVQPNNRSHVSSLIYNNSKIYIGSNNEIGYAERNTNNQIIYTSLNEKLTGDCKKFNNVWRTLKVENTIYFCTDHSLFKYNSDNNKLICIPHDNRIKDVIINNNVIFFLDETNSIYKFQDGKKTEIYKKDNLPRSNITHLVPFGKKNLLIHTEENEFYTINENSINPFVIGNGNGNGNGNNLQNISVSTINQIDNNTYCIGTTNNGVYFINKSGKILDHLNRDNKLLSNTVVDSFVDKDGNLWLSFDSGVSYVQLNSPFNKLGEQEGLLGSTYDMIRYNDELYVATSNGVFYSKWPRKTHNEKFKKLLGVEGQVWNLSFIQNKLLIGAHQGSYELVTDNELKTKKAEKISSIEGGWNFVKIPNNENLILQGTYSGLILYEIENDDIQFKQKIVGFEETAREVVFHKNNEIWISQGYKGIFKLKLDVDYTKVIASKLYTKNQGLPSNLFNSILGTNNKEISFGTQAGVYKYSQKKDSIIPSKKYSKILTNSNLVRKLSPISEYSSLFIQGYDRKDDLGLINFTVDGDFSIQRTPFQYLQGKLIPAFEKFTPLENNKIGFTSKDGIIIYNKQQDLYQSKNFKTIITKIKIKDSIIYGSQLNIKAYKNKDSLKTVIPFNFNKIKFSFVAPFYQQLNSVKYQTYLEGFDNDWSEWKTTVHKEYDYLPDGDYTLKVRAKNIYDQLSSEDSYMFTILPPWYRSVPMYLLYLLISTSLIYLVIRFKNIQRKKSVERLKLLHQKQIEIKEIRYEEKIIKLKNEQFKKNNQKLKKHIKSNNKELAASAMQMVQVENSIRQMSDVLNDIMKQTSGENKKNIKNILKTLDDQFNGEDYWKQFEIHFNQIHNNALNKLKEMFPDLNHREIRLCAYLKLNLSSKEIAPLMGISYRGVESLRFRLRKKIKLDSSINLTDYIIDFK